MKIFMQRAPHFMLAAVCLFCFPFLCFGGLVYQGFEGSGELGWAGSGSSVRRFIAGEPVHSGDYSFRADSCSGTIFTSEPRMGAGIPTFLKKTMTG